MSNVVRQTGPISKKEQKFINTHVKDMDVEDIAKALRRTTDAIERYINRKGLRKADAISISVDQSDFEYWATQLKERSYWNEVKSQLSDKGQSSELDYFMKNWIKLMIQFGGDVLHSEELQIKQWLILDILINRNLRERKRCEDELLLLQEQLDKEQMKTPQDAAVIAMISKDISIIRGSITTFTGEHTKLLSEVKFITKNLKADRSDRISRIENPHTTFVGWLKLMDDEQEREKLGEEIELLRLAKDKSREDLSDWHTFSDNALDQPFLTPETVKDE